MNFKTLLLSGDAIFHVKRVNKSHGQSTCRGTSTRRKFVATGATATTLGLAGCLGGLTGGGNGTDTSGGGDDSFEDQTLRVVVWSGSYKTNFEETVKPLYEEQTGGTLQVTGGWSEILSKIKAAPENDPPYDVAIVDGNFYYNGNADDLFLPVRYENVPNRENIYPYLRDFRTDEFGVPIDGGPMAIVWTDDLGWEPSSFKDFSTDKGANANLAMEGSGFEYPLHIAAIASDEKEGAQELYDDSTREAVWDTLAGFDVDSWYSGGAKLWENFRNGTSNLGQWYMGTGYAEASERDDWHIHFPEQTVAYYDHFCVVRGTSNRAMAEHFLDFLASAEAQTEWATKTANLFSNKNVQYPEPFNEWYPSTNEEYQKIAMFDWDYLIEYNADLSERFKEFKTQT